LGYESHVDFLALHPHPTPISLHHSLPPFSALALPASAFASLSLNCRTIGGWVANPTSVKLALHYHPSTSLLHQTLSPSCPPFPFSASAGAYAHSLLGRATFLHTVGRPATAPTEEPSSPHHFTPHAYTYSHFTLLFVHHFSVLFLVECMGLGRLKGEEMFLLTCLPCLLRLRQASIRCNSFPSIHLCFPAALCKLPHLLLCLRSRLCLHVG
jgi:hypothetical protein